MFWLLKSNRELKLAFSGLHSKPLMAAFNAFIDKAVIFRDDYRIT
jgi:hypothetical protein